MYELKIDRTRVLREIQYNLSKVYILHKMMGNYLNVGQGLFFNLDA